MCEKSTLNILLNGEKKTDCLFSKTENKAKMSALTTSIQHCTEGSGQSKEAQERRPPDWKGRVKLSLFIGNTIVYVENPKLSTIKLQELMKEFSHRIRDQYTIINCMSIYLHTTIRK